MLQSYVMLKTISAVLTTLSLFVAISGFAQETYVVKKGDTLSQLVKRMFPHDSLYGSQGKLAEILSQNPQIKNPHLIFPGHKIILPIPIVKESVPAQEEVVLFTESPMVNRHVSFLEGTEDWNISLLYGAKYFSLNQSGALGNAQVGVMFFNDLNLNSEFRFEDWSFGFLIDSYKFTFESQTSSDSKQMSSLELFASYKWVDGGIGLEQSPLFRNNNGRVEMTKQSLAYMSLGGRRNLKLPTIKPTMLKFKASIRYPLATSSEDPQIELDSVSGLGVRGQVELNRQILEKETYSLHVTWLTDFGYQKISQKVQWDTSSGEVKSDIADASASLGLLFQF